MTWINPPPEVGPPVTDSWEAPRPEEISTALFRVYQELVVAQHDRITDDGYDCTCEPEDACPLHRAHEALTMAYDVLKRLEY